MAPQPKVTIGMPVYNDRAFIRSALDSLLSQTFRDFEICIIDDCSTDGSEDICKEYVAHHNRVHYTRNKSNLGISRCMEMLLAGAHGEYFMWAADDDIWDSRYIERLQQALETNPQCMLAFAPYSFIDEEGEPIATLPVRAVDYSGLWPLDRLAKLAEEWDDGPGYGLFRRAEMDGVRFPRWWWVNADCAYNNIYPSLHFYLAKSDYVLVGEQPLWFNRIKSKPNHSIPYEGRLFAGFGAFALRKFNVAVESMRSIRDGSGSMALALRAAPRLARRVALDCSVELASAVRARVWARPLPRMNQR